MWLRHSLALLPFVWVAQSDVWAMNAFSSRPIGREAVGEPWITNVHVVDLDGDGLLDVLVCDGRLNTVSWIQQVSPGDYVEKAIGGPVPGPVSARASDVDGDGDLDVLVASMGTVIPNDNKIGSVVVLENLGDGTFRNRVVLEHVSRVCYVGAGDLDGDGDLDLSVGLFGFVEGEIRWLENRGDWKFASHALLDYAGTIHALPGDMDGDGDLDILALVSQDWEEIHAFENLGDGSFNGRVAYGAMNKNFGSSGIDLGDIDGDGDLDIAYTNGDGLDYATPGARSWHGLQWLENDGKGLFSYHRIGDLPGAHSPYVVDMDGDGDKDIVVTSGFNDWLSEDSASLVCYLQGEDGGFEPVVIGQRPTHLVTVDGGDFDGDGQIELVTGGFMYYPPFTHKSRVTLWERKNGDAADQ